MKSALKPLVRSLLLVLGLSPVATLSADEFSQTSSTRKGAGQPAAASVFTGTVVQNIHYAPQLNLGGFYGTGGNSYAEADVWLPLWQTSDQVAYADVRYQKEENTQWDIALGGGYRWLSEDMARLYDVYGFYNSYNSSYNNQFQQIMVGSSVRNEDWTLRANYYFSVGPTQYAENSLDNLSFQPIGAAPTIQNYGLLSYGFEENSINGGVIEIGRTVPAVAGLSLFGGYYGFASTSVNPFMNGFRARAEYVLDEAFNFSTPFLRHVTLESMVQYDNVNKGVFTIGARFDIPLGKSSTNSKLQAAMMDYVHFYPHAVQEEVTFTTPVIYQQNGQAVIFDIVNTPGQFIDAMDDGSNVVIINNDLQFGNTQTLSNNKYITGQNYEYSPGEFINVTGKPTVATITAAADSNLFNLGLNDTVRDMSLVVTSATTDGDPYYVLTDTNTNVPNRADGASVGTLVVDNIMANGSIYVSPNDGDSSTINVTNSTFNLASTGGNATNNAAIDLETDGASMTVNAITGNTITYINNLTGYSKGIYLLTNQYGDTQIIGNVVGNTVNFISGNAAGSVIGIYFLTSGTQTIESVNNNVITFGDNASNANGIAFTNHGVIQNITGSVNNNMVNFEGTATNSQGIYLSNSGTQTIGSVNSNTVNFDGAATTSQGIEFVGAGSGSLQIGTIQSNKITFTGKAATTNGILFQLPQAEQNNIAIGNVEANVINFKGGADVTSNGIFIQSTTGSGSATVTVAGIINNTISFGENSSGYGDVQAHAITVFNASSQAEFQINAMYGNNVEVASGMPDLLAAIYLQAYTTTDSLVIATNQPGGTNSPGAAGLSEANNGLSIFKHTVSYGVITLNGEVV